MEIEELLGRPASREIDLQNHIRNELAAVPGLMLFRANLMGQVQNKDGRRISSGLPKGFPDLFGCYLGRFVAIEAKLPSGRVSPEQKSFIESIQRGGGLAGVARSVADALRILGVS
jgi:hypothetical protein